ncbi:MAG: hypothetical protein KatS3mg108_1806 [Isosphaeraceae bacterium]|nr:MAG: hypothetical protein KatS3mg108_1806 [Isosphaeraceae bacterium]
MLVSALDVLGGLAVRAWRCLRPPTRVESPQRILLVQLDHLGDAVLSTPMLARLRHAFPAARIDVLASASNRAVFEAAREVDQVHVAERNWFERRPAGWALGSAVWSLGRRLRRERYDLGIDVRGDILSIAVLALAGIPRRVGWSMGGGGFLLTDIAPWVPGRHEVQARLALLDCLNLAPSPEVPRVSIGVDDADRATVARLWADAWPASLPRPTRSRPQRALRVRTEGSVATGFTGSRLMLPQPIRAAEAEGDALHAGRFGSPTPLLAVHLGAGTAAKRWPLPHWESLIARFLRDGWRVVVIGGPEEAALRLRLTHAQLRDWTGLLTVPQTTALLERADLFLGADSGPAHLAAAAGVPSVILFSGTNRVAQWRPWSRHALVLRHRVPCAPCHRKICPLADHPCLAGLSPERVHRAARRWWARLHHHEAPHPPL